MNCSKIADVGNPKPPTPLASPNVGNGDTPPPLRHADVLNGWSPCKSEAVIVFCFNLTANELSKNIQPPPTKLYIQHL